MGTLEGKVAFITGAARGQGRSHAVRLAEEGANIIGIDLCDQVSTVQYPMSTEQDLEETVARVEAVGGKMYAQRADVRDLEGMQAVVDEGVARFGRLDIVLANAGIMFQGTPRDRDSDAFKDALDIMLTGAWNTIRVCLPQILEQGEGGSIVLTSSTNGLKGSVAGVGGGNFGYAAAKHGVVGLMRMYANYLAPHKIRVNTIHPTGVDTPMLEGFAEFVAQIPADELPSDRLGNPMPVERIEAIDVSNAIAWLVSDSARYVTGITLPVDAGYTNK